MQGSHCKKMLRKISLFSLISSTLAVSEFPLLLVIAFHGFRHDFIHRNSTPNIHSLMNSGVHAVSMKGTFATKTYPNLFSLATGFYQESHGIMGNEMYDPVLKEHFDPGTAGSEWWDNGIVQPVWVANEFAHAQRYSGGIGWPAMDVDIRGKQAFYTFNQSSPGTLLIDTAIKWFTDKTKPANCVFMYFNKPAGTDWAHGPESEQVNKGIEEADGVIQYLIEKLKEQNLFQKMNIIIVGDHGLASVKDLIEVDSIVDPHSYTAFGESPVWNILPNDGNEDKIYKKLKESSETLGFQVYKKEEIPEEYHYKNNGRVLPLLMVAGEGRALVHKEKNDSALIWGGSGGYNNSLPSMGTVFIGHGPAFKQNYCVDSFTNVDLYPLMCHILQIGPFPSNGSFENVEHMLSDSKVSSSRVCSESAENNANSSEETAETSFYSNLTSTVEKILASMSIPEGIGLYFAVITALAVTTVSCMACICKLRKKSPFMPLKHSSKNGKYEQHFLIRDESSDEEA